MLAKLLTTTVRPLQDYQIDCIGKPTFESTRSSLRRQKHQVIHTRTLGLANQLGESENRLPHRGLFTKR